MNHRPVFLLPGLCHAASAAALGLGEISVRSHLGQPLHATVALLGAPAETIAASFSLDASEDALRRPRAQLDIEQSGAHLLEQLVNVWSTPDINAFFHDLIYDDRGGTRMGFDPGAYRGILLLRAIAQDALPLAA